MRDHTRFVIVLVILICILFVACNKYTVTQEVDPPFDIYTHIYFDKFIENYTICSDVYFNSRCPELSYQYAVIGTEDSQKKEFKLPLRKLPKQDGSRLQKETFNLNQALFWESKIVVIRLFDEEGNTYSSKPRPLQETGISYFDNGKGVSIDPIKLEFDPWIKTYTNTR